VRTVDQEDYRQKLDIISQKCLTDVQLNKKWNNVWFSKNVVNFIWV